MEKRSFTPADLFIYSYLVDATLNVVAVQMRQT